MVLRHFGRLTVYVIALLLAALLSLSVAMCCRSYWANDEAWYTHFNHLTDDAIMAGLISRHGSLMYSWNIVNPHLDGGISFRSTPLNGKPLWSYSGRLGKLGFIYWSTYHSGLFVPRGFILVLPYWFVILIFSALFFPFAARRVLDRRRHAASDGRCLQCGYNLTGNTSGICPECGTEVSATSIASHQ